MAEDRTNKQSGGIPSRTFAEVENAVSRLRRRQNQMSRQELQDELRKLMVLDDQGYWWMLGMETDQWYRFDGKEWVQEDPPIDEQAPTQTMEPPTQTLGEAPQQQESAQGATDFLMMDETTPLPRAVPPEDLDSTLVNPRAAFRNTSQPPNMPTREIDLRVAQQSQEYESRKAQVEKQSALTQPAAAKPQPAQQESAQQPPVYRPPAASTASAPPKPASQPVRKKAPESTSFRDSPLVGCIWKLTAVGVIGVLVVFLLGLLGMIGAYLVAANRYSERVEELIERAGSFQTTRIYDTQGNVLNQINDPYGGTRYSIDLEDMSPYIIHAVISTEDEEYYQNPGFNLIAIGRAMIQNIVAREVVSGASTITQQLARALLLDPEHQNEVTLERKLTEIILAAELYRNYDKNEILEIYLNEVNFGNLAYGVEAAAQTYFDKSASQLSLAESAFIAGLIQSPAVYDPVQNPEGAFARMQDVLRLMVENDCVQMAHPPYDQQPFCVTQEDVDQSAAEIEQIGERTFERPEYPLVAPHFVSYVWQQLEEQFGVEAIYSAGYNVYTTLDPQLQRTAEDAVANQIAKIVANNATNAAVVVLQPSDGAIKAMVGSAGFENEAIDGQVNVATRPRQPGSTIKLLDYIAALEAGWTPGTVIWDVPTTYRGSPPYTPRNYDGQYHGPLSLRVALANSYNVPAVKALEFVGMDAFKDVASRLGITFYGSVDDAGLAAALGAAEVTPLDMTSAYATIANYGKRVMPYAIDYITDNEGNIIYEAVNTSTTGVQVVRAAHAYLITDILSDHQARAAEFGTGSALQLPTHVAAAKTGTSGTDAVYDNWTVGYTPWLAVGVWVGNSDRSPINGLSGLSGAAPIWRAIMIAAHADKQVLGFQAPQGIIQRTICEDGSLPNDVCPGNRTYNEIFYAEQPPPEIGFYKAVPIDQFSGLIANEHCPDNVAQEVFLVLSDETAQNWINNTRPGQEWAGARGIEVPLKSPPDQACYANMPRPNVQINYPPEGSIVNGVIDIQGTVDMQQGFSYYILEYGVGENPQGFASLGGPQNQQIVNGTLGQFDTTAQPDGTYTLRLVAFDTQGRSVSQRVRIIVDNP